MENMMTFKVVFTHTKPCAIELIDRAAEDEFIRRRQIAVDKFNPCYEKWNKEFKELYPECNGYDDEYLDFIRYKQEDGLAIANKADIQCNIIELFSDDNGDVAGRNKYTGDIIELNLVKE